MSESSKRSKSRKKPSKKPSKKSVNAKKTRKTRKNKVGGEPSKEMSKGTCFAANIGVGVIAIIPIIFTIAAIVASDGAISGEGILTSGYDCDTIEKNAYKSLTLIGISTNILELNEENGIYQGHKYIKTNIVLDTYVNTGTSNIFARVNEIFGMNFKTETDKTPYTLVHIKKNGLTVNKDEYYLFEKKDGELYIDILRSITFTHMNRYISKYGIISSRKYHLIKLLLKTDPTKVIVEYSSRKILEDIVSKMRFSRRELFQSGSTIDNIYKLEDSEKVMFDAALKSKEKAHAKYIEYWTIFKNAAEYACGTEKYKHRAVLQAACNTVTEGVQELNRKELSELSNNINNIIIVPAYEMDKFGKYYKSKIEKKYVKEILNEID